MLLTAAELNSLANLVHQSPHTLLGMHPLGDRRRADALTVLAVDASALAAAVMRTRLLRYWGQAKFWHSGPRSMRWL